LQTSSLFKGLNIFNQFKYTIHPGSKSNSTFFHIKLQNKTVVNLIVRSLKGTVVFRYIRILDRGDHKIEFDNTRYNEDVFLVFLEVNNELKMKKITIQ